MTRRVTSATADPSTADPSAADTAPARSTDLGDAAPGGLATEPALTVEMRGVSRSFGAVNALADLDLLVPSGRITVLLARTAPARPPPSA